MGRSAEQFPPKAWCIETDVAMPLKKISPRERLGRPRRLGNPARTKKVLNRLLEHRLIKRVSFEEYREKVRDVYDGPQGAMLADVQHALAAHALGRAALSGAEVRPPRGPAASWTWAAGRAKSPSTC